MTHASARLCLVLFALGVGCDRSGASPAVVDAARVDRAELATPSPLDAGVVAPDRPPPFDVGARIDAPIVQDVPSPEDLAADGWDVVINEPDAVPHDARYPPRDVIQRDIEVTRYEDVPFVTSFGAPRQMRARCAEPEDGDPSIAAPRLVFPMSPMRVTSQRPTLFWSLPPGVEGARVELCRDRCCTQPIMTIDAAGSSARPPAALSAGVVFWRARGRVGARYGRATSFTWEFGVKHRDAPTDTAWGTIHDFNGDGYDDLINPIYSNALAPTRIYWGGEDGLNGSRFQTIEFGSNQGYVSTGDFNGDGLADAVVTDAVPSCADDGGLPVTCSFVMTVYGHPGRVRADGRQAQVGLQIMATADVNGDGFSDLITSLQTPVGSASRVNEVGVFFGAPEGLFLNGEQIVRDPEGSQIRNAFGKMGTSGDLNGDGYGDVVLSDTNQNQARGRLYVFRGGPDGVEVPHGAVIDPSSVRSGLPVTGPLRFGSIHGGVGDLDGDRRGDYLVSNANYPFVDLYRGADATFLDHIRTIHSHESDRGYGPHAFGGRPLDGLDLDGDGLSELVLTCSHCGPTDWMVDGYGRGSVFVYTRPIEAAATLRLSLIVRGLNDGWDYSSSFGQAVASADYDGDGFDDLAIGDPESSEHWARPRRGRIHVIFGGAEFPLLRRQIIFGESLPSHARFGIGAEISGRYPLRKLRGGA